MPIVYLEQDLLDLLIDTLIEKGDEHKVLDIIDMTNDSDCCGYEEEEKQEEEEEKKENIFEDKVKERQLKRGRIQDF